MGGSNATSQAIAFVEDNDLSDRVENLYMALHDNREEEAQGPGGFGNQNFAYPPADRTAMANLMQEIRNSVGNRNGQVDLTNAEYQRILGEAQDLF